MPSGSTARLSAKQCPLCGQRFSNDAAFCPFDGERLISVAETSFRDPLLGTVVEDRYRVIEAVGEGGMGVVYRVQHRDLPKTFAMKVLRANLAREPELSERFIHEARTAATVNHPNVVQITDFGYLPNGLPFFIMEFLKGQPLSNVLKENGAVDIPRSLRILEQVCAGVQAAHDSGIVHRDLKPDNIFLLEGEGDRVKLLDFGVAKVAGEARRTRTGTVFGSPHYMSPEQATGKPVDGRSDIYSIGVVMYRLFTGTLPFEADTYMGVLTKHVFVTPDPFSARVKDASSLGALEAITMKCLQKRPENRYATASELARDLHEVLVLAEGGKSFHVLPPGFQPPSAKDERISGVPSSMPQELPWPGQVDSTDQVTIPGESGSKIKWAVGLVLLGGAALAAAVVVLLVSSSKRAEDVSRQAAMAASASTARPVGSASGSLSEKSSQASSASPSPSSAKDAGGGKDASPKKKSSAQKTAKRKPSPKHRYRPSAAAKPPPAAKRPSTSGDLVNPWAN